MKDYVWWEGSNNLIEILDGGHLAMLEQPDVVAKEIRIMRSRYES